MNCRSPSSHCNLLLHEWRSESLGHFAASFQLVCPKFFAYIFAFEQRPQIAFLVESFRMPFPASGFEPIDHTADVGYRLFAPTLPELFVIAGKALFDAITELDSVRRKSSRTVRIEAGDVEALLVAWLAELNYHCITDFELYNTFEIRSFSPQLIEAVAYGEKIDVERHEIKTEIKAVTYHGLYVREIEHGWEAQIIFDV
jgi:SHS2 domain-containing protein